MMIPHGIKNCLKSFSLGNLNVIGDDKDSVFNNGYANPSPNNTFFIIEIIMNQNRRKSSTDLLTMPKLILSRRSQSPSKMLHITELWTTLSKGVLDYNSIEDDIDIDMTDSRIYAVNTVRNDKHNLSSTNLMDYDNEFIIQPNFNSSFTNIPNKNLTPNIPHRNRQRRSSFSLLFPTKGYSESDQKDIREERIREMCLKLKEFSASVLSNSMNYNSVVNNNFPGPLPENNLKLLQVSSNKEIYQQQSAIWELLVTEQNFLKQIQFIVQVYVNCFEKLRQKYFPKVLSEEIFSNLKEVCRVSLEFWKNCMQPVVENYEATKCMFKPSLLKNGFIKIGEILEPYIIYCTEISKCRTSILSLEKSNELFAEYTKWAMNLEESNREMLCDHLAKPFLRLTKYKILLQAIHKYSETNDKREIEEMIEAVDTFVSHVNEKIEETNLIKKLQNLNSFIDSYDVIEPLGDDLIPIINQYSKFDLTTPIHLGKEKFIRQILHQGYLKLREGSSKTVDVKIFLLTDILLITKYKKKPIGKLKVIKPPISLDTIQIQKHNSNSFVCVCLNEFNCIYALYHFSHADQKIIDEWIDILHSIKKMYFKEKSIHTNSYIFKELHDTIPTLKIVKSSPKHETMRFKSQSNSESLDNNLHNEFSFKRKAPVTKKHKSKKETVSLKSKSTSGVTPQRKNSNPIFKPSSSSFSDKCHKLYKSNSFVEDKETSRSSDCSDIDELYESKLFLNFGISKKYDKIQQMESKNSNTSDLTIKDTRKMASKKENKTQFDLTSHFDNNLNRKHSISLNTLNS